VERRKELIPPGRQELVWYKRGERERCQPAWHREGVFRNKER
jgi:hypothetical protein